MNDFYDRSNMPFTRRRADGSYEKNAILKKIYRDFGALGLSTRSPYGYTYSKKYEPGLNKKKLESPPRTADSANNEPYKPKGTARHANFDSFIDNLNDACDKLPRPFIEDFGRVRPQTVQSQPLRERVCKVVVQVKEPVVSQNAKNAQNAAGEEREEKVVSHESSKTHSKSMEESRIVNAPRLAEISTSVLPEVGPRKYGEDAKRESERQAKSCSAYATIDSKRRMEVVKAATMLQSRFRGYKVRRTQPLKHMFVIGGARAKLQVLKQQFNAWKIAVWYPADYSERHAMTENVMNLLIQLESLKSVPLYVRDFRKSVARDVRKFQDEVDAFLRRNCKHGALFDLVGSDGSINQKPRPKSRAEGRGGEDKGNGTGILNCIDPKNWKSVNLSGSTSEGDFTGDEVLFAAKDTVELSETDGWVEGNQGDRKDHSLTCTQEIELETGVDSADNMSDNNQPDKVALQTFDIIIPLLEDGPRNLRKKYGVRFEDFANQTGSATNVQPCMVTEQYLDSCHKDLTCKYTTIVKADQAYEKENLSDKTRPPDLTGPQGQCHEDYFGAPTVTPMFETTESLPLDARVGEESRKQSTQPGSMNAHIDQAPRTERGPTHGRSTNHVLNNSSGFWEDANCPESSGDEILRRRVEYQGLMADIRNAAATRFDAFRTPTISPKTRFHDEHSLQQATPVVPPVGDGQSDVNYERSYNSFDVTDSECSEELDGVDGCNERCGDLVSEAIKLTLPPCSEEKIQISRPASNASGYAIGTPRFFMRDFEGLEPPCRSSNSAFGHRITDAEEEIKTETEVEMDGLQQVEDKNCSHCGRQPPLLQQLRHCTLGCLNQEVNSGVYVQGLRNPGEVNPSEVQGEYFRVGFQDGCNRGEFCSDRELVHVADSLTVNVKEASKTAEMRAAQDDFARRTCPGRPKASLHGLQEQRGIGYSTTSWIGCPAESVRPDVAERPYSSSRKQSPCRQIIAPEEKETLVPDKTENQDKSLVSKLADDNKRLKGLLKDVMNWNKAQATAMVSMSERIEHLEGLNILN